MCTSRYAIQQERIRQIAERVFSGCTVHFGTAPKPEAVQLWITDSNGTMICEFPGETDLLEIEQMSDEQIEKRLLEVSAKKIV